MSSAGVLSGTLQQIEPSTDAEILGTPPVFSTASGSLGTFANTATVSTSVSASLPGATITYAVSAPGLPWGVTLDPATGNITGTLNPTDDAGKTFGFTVRALAVSGGFADRTFSITVQ
ncbi:MAG: hypothetical protein EOO77_40785 [Oxalobacteraceae bacterium]|nr:MAG: hypothetical protein EOO77_40785 [Oxalobacteraceae bacterium]